MFTLLENNWLWVDHVLLVDVTANFLTDYVSKMSLGCQINIEQKYSTLWYSDSLTPQNWKNFHLLSDFQILRVALFVKNWAQNLVGSK